MIKKIKEIIFNTIDYNRDGQISNTEFWVAIVFIMILYSILLVSIFLMSYIQNKYFNFDEFLPF